MGRASAIAMFIFVILAAITAVYMVVLTLPVLVFFPLVQKRLTTGLVKGAVKG